MARDIARDVRRTLPDKPRRSSRRSDWADDLVAFGIAHYQAFIATRIAGAIRRAERTGATSEAAGRSSHGQPTGGVAQTSATDAHLPCAVLATKLAIDG